MPKEEAHHIKTLGILQEQERPLLENNIDIQYSTWYPKQSIPKWNPDVSLQKNQITLDSQVFWEMTSVAVSSILQTQNNNTNT